MATKTKENGLIPPHVMLLDSNLDLNARRQMLAELCNTNTPAATKVIKHILESAAKSNGADLEKNKKNELAELIDALQSGPQRPGVFMGMMRSGKKQPRRAHVKVHDGTSVYPVVPDAKLADKLTRGDCVLLSARAEALLDRDSVTVDVGEQGKLESWNDDRVEISMRADGERHVVHLTENLREQLETGEVKPGDRLLVCPRRQMAWDAVPRTEDELSQFKFLCKEPVPAIDVDRDVADPPPFIDEVARFCKDEMTGSALAGGYKLRRSQTHLLSGVSGSGKTLSVNATIRRVYEVVAEVTGLPIDEVPPRVLRLRLSKLLSKWLGESDKNADRLVDEIEMLAAMPVVGPNGEFETPVIVVLEEFDGIGRSRGQDHDAIYDRVQTSLMQRMDHTANRTFRDRLVFVFTTTNVPQLLDQAWMRRVGGETHHFGRLGRRGAAAVLARHLDGMPIDASVHANGVTPAQRVVGEVAAALYSSNETESPLIEVMIAGVANGKPKHRRDFVTGSIIDRGVQQAALRAYRRERDGGPRGVTTEMVVEAIDQQINAVASQVTRDNAANFVDLRRGARVTDVVHHDRPAVNAATLTRS